jgi:hypothetical protein
VEVGVGRDAKVLRRRRRRSAAAVLLNALAITACPGARAPVPLAPPPPGLTLADVTVVDPGRARRDHQTLRVTGAAIDSIAREPPARG